MRRALFSAVAVVLGFLLGVSLTAVLRIENRQTMHRADLSSLPVVSFCELFSAPERFEARLVKVRAVYSWGPDGSAIGDYLCFEQDHQTAVVVAQGQHDAVSRALVEAWGQGLWPPNLEVIAVGTFRKNHPSRVGNSLVNHAPYRFELLSIEKAARPN